MLNINANDNREAQDILNAIRQIQDSPELQAEAKTQPESVLDRLSLNGIARHAVSLAITGLLVAPVAAARPLAWW